MHRFAVHVTAQHADLALRRFILRNAGIGSFVAAALCMIFVALDALDRKLETITVVSIAVIALLLILYATIFVARRKQMRALLEQLAGRPVTWEFEDWVLTARSALGRSTLKWELLKKLWIDPDLVMIFFSQGAYSTLPTDQIPPESLRFLKAKVLEFGGKVVDNLKVDAEA